MKRINRSKYIDILSDFGWEFYFGREENKGNLINFLNSLLEDEHTPIYFVAVLGFRLDVSNKEKYYYSAKIMDELDQEVLYPKLSYKLLVLPNFNKSKTDLPTIMDQWMYLMKHLDEIEELPNYLDKRIFSRIFEVGELAKLTPEEKMSYISSLDRKRDYINTLAYAKKEGKKEAEAKAYAEKLTSAKKMVSKGIKKEEISDILGLSIEEVEKL